MVITECDRQVTTFPAWLASTKALIFTTITRGSGIFGGPADVFCDNHGVVMNSSKPESTLQKKCNAINYLAVCEAAAAGILRVRK